LPDNKGVSCFVLVSHPGPFSGKLMKIALLTGFLFLFISFQGISQDTASNKSILRKIKMYDTLQPIYVPGKIMDGDTLPSVDMSTVTVYPQPHFVDYNELLKYEKLVYRVRKVYPYAKLAAKKLEQYQKILDTIPTERARRKFIKKAQKELEDQFGEQIKALTFSQGKILIKLIYRETGNSTFEIVKELRGGFNAFIWQTMAGLFGYDLKTTYDPENEDQAIEQIVRMIDAGAL
jgi:hypothetical protein